jgi:hypothetical protein
VLEVKVLVLELLAVDALTASAIASGEITTLDHEGLDDTVEGAALEVQRLAGLTDALLASAEGAEVVCGLGDDIVVELEDDAASRGDVEPDAGAVFGHVVGVNVLLVDRYEVRLDWE